MARIVINGEDVTPKAKAPKFTFSMKEVTEMFDRAEALQNTAKTLKGLQALDEDALELLYAATKAERRAREKATLNKRVAAVLAKRFGDGLWDKPTDELSRIENEVRSELKIQDAGNSSVVKWTEEGEAVIQPGMQAVSVTFAGPQTPEDVKALKDLGLTLSKEKPDADIEHMHVLEDGDIEVTFADGYVVTFRQD
ncbi:hypothetical protein ABZ714_14285 [Streptomyces sp. NPDC006798]|uniref:hypothetical protein n=1 Tax=unclassified Streptomyces TaxID=2593676 RepID=UPI00340B795F